MMPDKDENKAPSRRERPAKPPLTREGTIAAALTILANEGLGKVTMRRIAAELDTGAASLYVYIRNTEDLHAQILDALLTRVTLEPLGDGDWRARLKELVLRYLRVLLDYPEMAKMAMSTLPSGPSYMSLVDAILALLKEGGVPDDEAAWAVDILLLYATAQAAEKSAWKASGKSKADFATLETAIREVDAQVYPNIAALGEKLLSGGGNRFEWGLDVLINGILATPRKEKS